MIQGLSVLAGILIAVMVTINGELSDTYGVYSATVIIHIAGALFVSVLLAVRRKSLKSDERLPLHYYLGGAVGVGTVVFNNMAFGRISVTAILALSLLGSVLCSLVVDQYGWFGMARHPVSVKKLPGIVLAALGIAWMLWPFDMRVIVPVIVSLLTGVTIVVSRSLNARLTCKTGMLQSTFFNYAVGLAVSAAILLAFGQSEPMMAGFAFSPRIWIYTGGMLGACIVTLFNAVSVKISSFYVSLLSFVGQIFAGVALDALLAGAFSLPNLIGGVLVTAGLAHNLWIDKKDRARLSASCPAAQRKPARDI